MTLPSPEDAVEQFGGTVQTNESDVYVPADTYQGGPVDFYLSHPASAGQTPHLFAGADLRNAWTAATEDTGENTNITSLCGGVTRNLSPAGFRRDFDERYFHFFQLLADKPTIFAEGVGEYPTHAPSRYHALLCGRCKSSYESNTPVEAVVQELSSLKERRQQPNTV